MDTVIKLILVFTLLLFVLTWINYINGGGSKVYVALLIFDHNEIENTKVVKIIGVYRKKEIAEAKLYKHISGSIFGQQATVTECVINKDLFPEEET